MYFCGSLNVHIKYYLVCFLCCMDACLPLMPGNYIIHGTANLRAVDSYSSSSGLCILGKRVYAIDKA